MGERPVQREIRRERAKSYQSGPVLWLVVRCGNGACHQWVCGGSSLACALGSPPVVVHSHGMCSAVYRVAVRLSSTVAHVGAGAMWKPED